MKTNSFYVTSTWLVLFMWLFFSCSNSDELTSQNQTYDEMENVFLKDFREKVRGDWKVNKMLIAKSYISDDSKNDSVVFNLGRIFINNIYNDPIHAEKYNQLEAFFYINHETIPFKSRLLASPADKPLEFKGVFGLMESDYYIPFPVSSDRFSEEYLFLDNFFFGDNYSMILSEDGKTFTWKGLNRHIREIVLTR